jgi:hypothetical protein
MNLIQLVLIGGIAGVFLMYVAFFRSTLWDRIIALALVILAVLSILFPQLTTAVANALGVGRGADLLIYLSIVTGLFVSLLLYSRIQRLERDQTELVRQIALERAKAPHE